MHAKRMTTQDKIRRAALKRFASQGFDGTAMSEIAKDVGIKTPGLYAHFAGKTELFLDLVALVIEQELSYTQQFLNEPGTPEKRLSAFLRETGRRFESSPQLRFILNAAYVPPRSIEKKIAKSMQGYFDGIEQIVQNVFKNLPPSRMTSRQLAAAYIGIIDSLQAELLYGGHEKFQKRLDAMWALFCLAIK
ncbi:TetR/AcrR family transcriptional regulator [Ereboglobus sp. PH5-10]|uniref:TetR/AcrR family transcriptional regulator n=1 Tax=Ereboglobus sp. PH5-10 TaxID=2940629 RepID=UPI0031B852F7